MSQLDLFNAAPALPSGFKYQPDVITADMEHTLLDAVRHLPFKQFEFHGFVGRRRTVSFGAAYDFAAERLAPAEPMPRFLLELRHVAAEFAQLSPAQLEQALVTEYGPNSAIGWHRDKGVFGEVVGISLLSACPFRLRCKQGDKWNRVTITAEPRSAYLLSGDARAEWEHSIPPVEELRYSVTFRAIR